MVSPNPADRGEIPGDTAFLRDFAAKTAAHEQISGITALLRDLSAKAAAHVDAVVA